MSSFADETRWLDATAQADLVRTGQVTPTELVEAAVERIEALDGALNAVTMRWFDHARQVAAGPLPDGPFRGVPFLLKDLWSHYEGQTLSNGNQALKDAAPVSAADTTVSGVQVTGRVADQVSVLYEGDEITIVAPRQRTG